MEIYHDEYQYITLIDDIINHGVYDKWSKWKCIRQSYGSAMHFSLEDNVIPILTTKKVAWKTCAKELFWFLSGSYQIIILLK